MRYPNHQIGDEETDAGPSVLFSAQPKIYSPAWGSEQICGTERPRQKWFRLFKCENWHSHDTGAVCSHPCEPPKLQSELTDRNWEGTDICLDWIVIVISSHWILLFKDFISYNVSGTFHRSDKTRPRSFSRVQRSVIPPSCSQQELVWHADWLIRQVWDSDSFSMSRIWEAGRVVTDQHLPPI